MQIKRMQNVFEFLLITGSQTLSFLVISCGLEKNKICEILKVNEPWNDYVPYYKGFYFPI